VGRVRGQGRLHHSRKPMEISRDYESLSAFNEHSHEMDCWNL
jgi:hypothetical protein